MGPHSPPGWATHLPGTSLSRPRAKAILPGLCVPRALSTGHSGTPSLGGALGSDTFCKTQGDRGVSSAGPVGPGRPEVQNFTWRRKTTRKAPRHPGAALARPQTHPDCRVPRGRAHPPCLQEEGTSFRPPSSLGHHLQSLSPRARVVLFRGTGRELCEPPARAGSHPATTLARSFLLTVLGPRPWLSWGS